MSNSSSYLVSLLGPMETGVDGGKMDRWAAHTPLKRADIHLCLKIYFHYVYWCGLCGFVQWSPEVLDLPGPGAAVGSCLTWVLEIKLWSSREVNTLNH